MIDVNSWMDQYLHKLQETFGARAWFVGLQGSYGRGEATDTSDLDVVLILDELSAQEMTAYQAMLDTLPHRELVCGFLSGKKELLNWEPADLFQFYHDTKPIVGSFDDLLPLLDDAAVNRAIKMGACNIYHGCVHNMLHDKSEELLRGLYKSASFVVQAICFQQTRCYISRQQELMERVAPAERRIVEIFLTLKNGGTVDFQAMSESLFLWAQDWIAKTK